MNSTPNSTPANSPIPNPQRESPCMTRRKFAMEMEVLNIKILSQSNLLRNIQRYPQYEDTELYQIEKKRTQDPGKKKRPIAQQLPRIAAVKNNRNQKYAIIEALLESESYV
ncbi:hypothetical protein NPIL_687231 [Nephila pilipes]|uniref:Uncharacterized protein n=1 Tax=Nephila pilipes TaxID=299642 RepID=A0A8X6Q8R9_NEPPI|nr:hypothetical protein NPIL_687231 [Nephila pilipes]